MSDIFSADGDMEFETSIDTLPFDSTDVETMDVSNVTVILDENAVVIGQNTLEALDIFKVQYNQSAYRLYNAQRSGFCIFNLFNKCFSKPGTLMLKEMFLKPSRNKEVLEYRANVVEVFADPANAQVVKELGRSMKKIKQLRPIFDRMVATNATVSDWRVLIETVVSMGRTKDTLKNCSGLPELMEKISASDPIWCVRDEILNVIDFERSTQIGAFQVNARYDETVDKLREEIQNVATISEDFTFSENDNLSPCRLSEPCLVRFFAQLGFLLQISVDDADELEALVSHQQGLNFNRIFSTATGVYYKNNTMTYLDDLYGDPASALDDIQQRHMNQLQEKVLHVADSVLELLHILAELDAFIAMGMVAIQFNLVRPTFNMDNVISIAGSRHLLQELVVDHFVPNDYESGGEKRVKILTGPNSSGKSVYLKQICLVVYLAHIGSFVPAESASLPLVDKILTRIKSSDSVALSVSSFAADLAQMNTALANATSHSLVAIDEFGQGTRHKSGVALLAASLRYWLDNENPHVLVATHFHSLSTFLLPQSHLLHYIKFDVDEDYQYQFKLVDGQADSSLACLIARQAHIDEAVVGRAAEVAIILANKTNIMPNYTDEFRNEVELYGKYGEALRQLVFLPASDNVEQENAVKAFLSSLK